MSGADAVEEYTPGQTDTAVRFMADRRAETHAAFFLPYLRPGLSLVDLGCGPGEITIGLAAAVNPGAVLGIDRVQRSLHAAGRVLPRPDSITCASRPAPAISCRWPTAQSTAPSPTPCSSTSPTRWPRFVKRAVCYAPAE
jgi:hypothetical protein